MGTHPITTPPTSVALTSHRKHPPRLRRACHNPRSISINEHLCFAGLPPPGSTGVELASAPWASASVGRRCPLPRTLSSPRGPPPAIKPSRDPQLPARRRRRLLLDDLGRIPVVVIDQRPHLGRLRGSGVGGRGPPAAEPSLEETRVQRRSGSRPRQPPADQHAATSAVRSQRAGLRHPPATASLSPVTPRSWPRPLPFKEEPLGCLAQCLRLEKELLA